MFKIGEHLAKLQVKWWLIVSYIQFALNVCPQRCRTRQIRKITCVKRIETVKLLLIVVMLIRRLM